MLIIQVAVMVWAIWTGHPWVAMALFLSLLLEFIRSEE